MASIMVHFRHKRTKLWVRIMPPPVRGVWEPDRIDATEFYAEKIKSVAREFGCSTEDLEAVPLDEKEKP